MQGPRTLRARSVALATGYFFNPRRLGVPGEDLPWVAHNYKEPYPHFGQEVVIVGAGNTAAEAALDLWRNGVRVTLVHRGPALKAGVKYWLKPDMENRIEEGSIPARFNTEVRAFLPEGGVELATPEGPEVLPAQAAYVLIGYQPDADFERRCGVEVDPETLIPTFDPGDLRVERPRPLRRRHPAGRPLDRPHLHRELPRQRPEDHRPPEEPPGGRAGDAVGGSPGFQSRACCPWVLSITSVRACFLAVWTAP